MSENTSFKTDVSEILGRHPVKLKTPTTIVSGTENHSRPDDGALTLDKIYAMMDKVRNISLPPFLASHSLLPANKAITFQLNGRTYIGAHPCFWAKFSERTSSPRITQPLCDTFTGIPIFDLDEEQNRLFVKRGWKQIRTALGPNRTQRLKGRFLDQRA